MSKGERERDCAWTERERLQISRIRTNLKREKSKNESKEGAKLASTVPPIMSLNLVLCDADSNFEMVVAVVLQLPEPAAPFLPSCRWPVCLCCPFLRYLNAIYG